MSTIINLNAYSDIANKIETMVRDHDIEYIDAIVEYCETNNLEIETVGSLIAKNPTMKAKVQIEAEALHFLKPSARLPI